MKVRITLSAKDIFEFSMYHTYKAVYGIIGVLISVVAFAAAIYSIGKTDVLNTVLLFVVGLMFTVFQPLMIWHRSKKQAKKNRSIGTYLEYTFNENGFNISDGENEDDILWPAILKISNTKNLTLLYTTMMRAFILPKAAFADKYDEFKNMINENVKNARGKVK